MCPDKTLSVEELAAMVYLSTPHFKQKFKESIGIPPAEFMLREKLDHAAKLLVTSEARVTDVAMALGFSTSQHFSVVFKRYFSVSPHEYQKQSVTVKNEVISCAFSRKNL
jgi:transcriptional regulator GlxA family with amidase domain